MLTEITLFIRLFSTVYPNFCNRTYRNRKQVACFYKKFIKDSGSCTFKGTKLPFLADHDFFTTLL